MIKAALLICVKTGRAMSNAEDAMPSDAMPCRDICQAAHDAARFCASRMLMPHVVRMIEQIYIPMRR